MKKLKFTGFILLCLFLITPTASAQLRVFTVPQGGTGASTLTGCLSGNGTSAITGSGVACAGSSFSWPFTKQADGSQGTTTVMSFLGGLYSSASSTFTYASTTQIGSTGNAYFATSNGGVGIGMIPVFKLDVTGSIRAIAETAAIDITNNGIVVQRSSNDSVLSIGYRTNPNAWGIAATYSSTGAYRPIVFYTSDAERVRIDTAGSLGIGTSSPSSKLSVSGNSFFDGNITAANVVATSTLTATNASTTLLSSTIASTSQFILSGAASGCATFSSAGQLSSTGVACGGTSIPYAFPLATNGTSSLVGLFGGFNSQASSTAGGGTLTTGLTIAGGATTTSDFLHLGSTTLQKFTATQSTTSQATTTNFAISGLSNNGFVKTYGGTGNFSIDTNTYLTSAITALTGSYPVKITTGSTPTISLDFSTTTANPWSLLQNFNMSSSTVASFGNAYFGKTATSSFDGTGALTVVASSTFQAFTGTNATTSQATTTALNVSNNFITIGSAPAYIASTSQRTLVFASSTLDANGFSLSIGTTTLPLGMTREATKIIGIGCLASTTNTVAGGFLVKLGTLPSTFTETVFCDTTYHEYNLTTNPQVAGHVPTYAFISKASSTPQTGWITEIYQRVGTGGN